MESESEKTVKTCAIQAERTRAEKAEAELDAVMHTIDKWFLEGVPDTNPATRAAEAREIALMAIDEERVRRQKAEAERDEARAELRHVDEALSGRPATAALSRCAAIEKACYEAGRLQDLKLATLAALTQAGIAMLEENPITPSEVKSAIRRLAGQRDSERVRAEKYLAAAGQLIDAMLTTGIVWKPEIWAAYQALKKIIEEARRAE